MKILLLPLVIALSLAGSIRAADEGVKPFKYEEGRAAERAYDQAVRKAVKDYAAAVQSAKKEYAAALDAALKKAMERADLDEANHLNAAQQALKKELVSIPPPVMEPVAAAPSESVE